MKCRPETGGFFWRRVNLPGTPFPKIRLELTVSQLFAVFEMYAKILAALGHGAMAAHRTLNPLILVRLQVPRPDLLWTHNLMILL